MVHERTVWVNKDRYGGVEIWPSKRLEDEIKAEGLEIRTTYLNAGGEYEEFATQLAETDYTLDEIPTNCMTRVIICEELAWALFGIEF
jgi:hypothetical protein